MHIRGRIFLLAVMTGIGLSAGNALAQGTCSTELSIVPIMSTHLIPPYPEVSIFANEEGTTTVQVLLDEKGNVADDFVHQSSGSTYLDDAAISFVKSTWKWQPPTRNCQPATARLLVQVKWELRSRDSSKGPRYPYILKVMNAADYPPEILARKKEWKTGVMIVYSETGTPLSWWIVEPSGDKELDKLSADEAMKRYQISPMRMTGQPIKGAAFFAIVWKLGGSAGASQKN